MGSQNIETNLTEDWLKDADLLSLDSEVSNSHFPTEATPIYDTMHIDLHFPPSVCLGKSLSNCI